MLVLRQYFQSFAPKYCYRIRKNSTEKQNALGAFLGKQHCAVALTKQILTKKDGFYAAFFVYLMRKNTP